MPDTKTEKPPTVFGLVTKALLWAFILGLGISVFLYGLAYFFGETEKSFLIALYWGPITAVFILIGMLFFQLPRAMKLKKGAFAIYLTFMTLPVMGLGGLFLWWLFNV
jgi:hypothetical protein